MYIKNRFYSIEECCLFAFYHLEIGGAGSIIIQTNKQTLGTITKTWQMFNKLQKTYQIHLIMKKDKQH